MNEPSQRAQDADAIYDARRNDPHVDRGKFGGWGFSNGGWTAPIVAVNRPLAFITLQSAPASTVDQNVIYEAEETMRGAHHEAPEIASAVKAWRSILDALEGRAPFAVGKAAYAPQLRPRAHARQSPHAGSCALW
jgi:hypothetical protein